VAFGSFEAVTRFLQRRYVKNGIKAYACIAYQITFFLCALAKTNFVSIKPASLSARIIVPNML